MRYDESSIYGKDSLGNRVIVKCEADGTINVKPTGGSDASAAKQDQQTTILQTLLTEGTAATAIAGPTGGSGAFKWLSGIWDLVNSIKGLLPSALVSDRLKVDLPSTAASSAKQDIGNTSLNSIDTKTPTLGQALAAASVPIVLTSAQLTTLTPIAGGSTETTLGKLIWTSTPITLASASYSSQNGSEKTWTVPTGVEWQLTDFYADFVTTATVGNRQLTVRITDSSDNAYCRLPVGITQAASLTRRYSWSVGLPDFTSFRDTDKLQSPLPPLILPAGFKIKILDTAVIDAASDALTVRGLVLQRSV